jgi:hypothetical protein
VIVIIKSIAFPASNGTWITPQMLENHWQISVKFAINTIHDQPTARQMASKYHQFTS